jgi:hypothetical protein
MRIRKRILRWRPVCRDPGRSQELIEAVEKVGKQCAANGNRVSSSATVAVRTAKGLFFSQSELLLNLRNVAAQDLFRDSSQVRALAQIHLVLPGCHLQTKVPRPTRNPWLTQSSQTKRREHQETSSIYLLGSPQELFDAPCMQ